MPIFVKVPKTGLLRGQKNKFLETIKAAKLDASLFTASENDGQFNIHVVNSPLYFAVALHKDTTSRFDFTCTIYEPSYRYQASLGVVRDFFFGRRGYSFYWVVMAFDEWLNNEVRGYLKREAVPDMWAQLLQSADDIDQNPPYSVFSDYEREEARQSVRKFRLLLITNFDPTAEQLRSIDEKLDYVIDALERLNKFDWKSVLVSTVIGIGTSLSVDTEKGRLLWKFVEQAFGTALKLLH